MDKYDSAVDTYLKASQAPPQASSAVAQQAVKQGTPDLIHSPDLLSQAKPQENAAIVARSPHMSEWAGSHPAHVAASQDHYPWLEGAGQVLQSFKNMVMAPPAERGQSHAMTMPDWMNPEFSAPFAEIAGETARQAKSGSEMLFGPGPVPQGQGSAMDWFRKNDPTSAKILDYAAAPFRPLPADQGAGPVSDWLKQNYPAADEFLTGVSAPINRALGAVGIAASPALGAAAAGPGRLMEQTTGVRRENIPFVLGALKGLGGKVAKLAEKPSGDGAPPPEPPPGGHPADVAEAMGSAVQAHPLTKAAPDTMKEFLHQQTVGSPLETVHLNHQAVLDLYEQSGHGPHPDDGMLGWVPDIDKQLERSMDTGGDIEVPLHEYLVNADTATQKALSGHMRIANESTREEEATQAGEGMDQRVAGATDHTVPLKPNLEVQDHGVFYYPIEANGDKTAGVITGRLQPDGKTYKIGMSTLRKASQRQGLGTEAYKNLADEVLAKGGILESDIATTAASRRVYEKLREAGYTVEENPESMELKKGAKGGGDWVFRVTKGPKASEASSQPIAAKDNAIPSPSAELETKLEGLPKDVKSRVKREAEKYFLSPLFDKAKTFNMTGPQAKAYSKIIEARLDKLVEKLKAEHGRMQKHITEKLVEEYLPAVRDELASNPALAARHLKAYGHMIGEEPKVVSSESRAAWNEFDEPAKGGLTPHDKSIIKDMQDKIHFIKASLEQGPNVGDKYRPLIGDAETGSKEHWEKKLDYFEAQIKDIEANPGRGQPTPRPNYAKLLGSDWGGPARTGLTGDQLHALAEQRMEAKYGPRPESARFEGMDNDSIAELFGFSSGEAMNKAIEPYETRRKSLKGKLSVKDHFEQMAKAIARYKAEGDTEIMSPARIEDITREALIGPQGRMLLEHEMIVLADAARAAGKEIPPFTAKSIAAHAEKLFAEVPVSQARNIKYWEKLALKQGQEAEIAGVAGKAKEAFEAKQRQTVSTHMLAQAHRFNRFSTIQMKRWKNWASNTTMHSIDQPWLDQMHAALSEITLHKGPKRTSTINVARDSMELQKALFLRPNFLAEQEAQGAEVYRWPVDKSTPVKQWSVEDFTGVANMLTSFAENGNAAAKLAQHVAGMKYEDIIQRIRDKVEDRGDRALTQAEAAKRGIQPGLVSALHELKGMTWAPPFMMNRLDNGDPFGPWQQSIDRPMSAATNWKADKVTEIGNGMRALAKLEPAGWQKRKEIGITSGIRIQHEDGSSSPYVRNRGELMAVALHFGSESGRAKLLKGTNTDEATWQALFDKYLDDPYDRDVLNHLWDTSSELWTHVEAMSRRMSGVAPKELVKAPFTINGDVLKGGYHWANYEYLYATEEQRTGARRGNDPFDLPSYQRATPPNGYVNPRTEFAAPFDLNLDNISTRMAQIVHDVAFREPVALAAKILREPAARAAIERVLGPEYPKQFDNYLQRVANSQAFDTRALGLINNLVRSSRYSMGMVMLAFRPATAIKHMGSAWAKSANELGVAAISSGSRDYWAHPIQVSTAVRGESSFMAHRWENHERDMRSQLAEVFAKQGYLTKFQQVKFYMVAASDWVSAVPTYTAARDAALAAGETRQDAIYLGERAVRRAHGSGNPIDLSALLDPRGENAEFVRSFSIFMSFFHNTLQQVYDIPEKSFPAAVGSLVLLLGVAAVIDWLVQGKAKEPVNTWAESGASAIAHVATGGIPLVSPAMETFVPALMTGKKPDYFHLLPQEDIFQTWGQNIADVHNLAAGKHVEKNWVHNTIKGIGYGTGFPGADYFGQVSQYGFDAYKGQVPQGTSPLSGILFGEHTKPKR